MFDLCIAVSMSADERPSLSQPVLQPSTKVHARCRKDPCVANSRVRRAAATVMAVGAVGAVVAALLAGFSEPVLADDLLPTTAAAPDLGVQPQIRCGRLFPPTLSPTVVALGGVSTPTTTTLTVSNGTNPQCPENFMIVSFGLANSDRFKVVGGTCNVGGYLPGFSSCTIEVQFTPNGSISYSDTLNVSLFLSNFNRTYVLSASLTGN